MKYSSVCRISSVSYTHLDVYKRQILDEEQQKEIFDYFMEAQTDNIAEAFDEFEGDYSEEDLRLMRLKFHSKHGN